MEIMEAILTRRSIRKYTGKPVGEALLRELLTAAMSAPSAGDQRPWHFVVITDRKTLDAVPRVHPYAQMLRQAPAAVLVCAELGLEKHKGYWVQDCSAATQNLLLAAHCKGLGAVWLGLHPVQERVAAIKKLLGLPEGVMPLSLVAIGYPAEKKLKEDRFDPARVHADKW